MSQGITIQVTAQTADAAQRLQQFFTGLNGNLNKMTGLGSYLEGLGAKLAAVFTVGTMVAFTREAINAAEALGKLSEKTGLAVETLSAFEKAAHAVGVPLEGIQVGLGLFADKIYSAVRQGGAALQTFRDLRIGLLNLDGSLRSTEEVLGEVMDRFKAMPDGPQKAAAAMDLFGRSGRELIPVLNQGAAGLERMRHEEGNISTAAAAAAREFNREMRELGEVLEKIFRQFTSEILPTLKVFVAHLRTTAEEADTVGRSTSGLVFLFKALSTAVVVGVAVFQTLGTVIGQTLGAAFEQWLDQVQTAIRMLGFLWDSLKQVSVVFTDLQRQIMAAGSALLLLQSGDVVNAVELLKEAMSGVAGKDAVEAARALGVNGGKAFAEFQALMGRTAARLKGVSGDALRDLQSTWSKAGELLNGIWNSEKFAGFARALEWSVGMIQRVVGMFTLGGGTRAAPVSETAKQLLGEIDKAYAESTKGKLALLEEEERALKEKVDQEVLDHEQAEAAKTKITEVYARKREELLRAERDAQFEIELAAVQGRRTLLERDPDLTSAQKKERLLALMRAENELLERNIELNRRRVSDLSLTPEARLSAQKQLQELEQKRAESQRQIATTSASGTVGGELTRAMVELEERLGTFAQRMAALMTAPFAGMFEGVSKSIEGLINGTMRWGEALKNIRTTLLGSVVKAFADMAAAWITNLTMMVVKYVAAKLTMLAVDRSVNAANKGENTVAGTIGAIAGVGQAGAQGGWVGILIYLGVLAAAIAAVTAMMGGFAEGGYTGAGGRYEPAGIVHRGEYVFSAPAVDRLGRGTLEALHSGQGGGAAAVGGAGGTQINIGVISDRNEIPNWSRSQAGEAHIVDIVRRNWHKLS